MLHSCSSSITLRTLRSQALRQTSAGRSSTTARRAEEAPSTAQPKAQLPYFIHRTKTKNLPVYEETKRGGSLRLTRIRKIDGDLTALRDDVIKYLGIDKKNVNIEGVRRHIVIKGFYQGAIMKWLGELRF